MCVHPLISLSNSPLIKSVVILWTKTLPAITARYIAGCASPPPPNPYPQNLF